MRSICLAIILGSTAPLAAEVYLLDGFRFGWRHNPHRVNQLGFELRADGSARTKLTGGPWADGGRRRDTGHVHVFRSAFDHPGIRTIDGSTPWVVASGRLRTELAAAAIAQTQLTVDLHATDFAACQDWSVLLRGFEIDTDCTHPDGFTTKGFGVRLGPPTVVAAGAASTVRMRFDATLRVQAGRLPLRQRPEKYTVRGRIHYTLVGLQSGRVTRAVHTSVVHTRGGTERPLHSAVQRVAVEGEPGYPRAALGLTGFDIRLNPAKRRFGGRYLRDLWLHNRHLNYEPDGGQMVFDSDVGFSNRSLWAYPTTTISEAHFALLQMTTPNATYFAHNE